MLRKVAYGLLAIYFLSGCQSSTIKTFDNLHAGMDKHQVLEAMGNPNATTRMHGKDRWVYNFYDDGIRFEKEVHFLNGVLVYRGDMYTPPAGQSAKEVDDKVAAHEEAIEKKEIAAKEERKKALENYEKQASQTDKVRYMPVFMEIK